MATFTKPTSVPRWADTSLNVTEPAEAKKDQGWVFEEIPPSSYENWKEKLNGEWWKWINERLNDGPVLGDLELVGSFFPDSDGGRALGSIDIRWGDVFAEELHSHDDVSGYTALSRTMGGVELSVLSMNPSAKYTTAVKFMSRDSDFTTENPKLLAAIAGRATDTYGADDRAGMAVDFFATPSGTGHATVLPSHVASMIYDGTKGLLGINVEAPTSPLHVWVAADISPSGTGAGYIAMQGDAYVGYLTMDADSLYLGHNSGGRGLALQTDETTRLLVDQTGDVGVGLFTNAAPPESNLHVRKSAVRSPAGGVTATLEHNGNCVLDILSANGTNNFGAIWFGDTDSATTGRFEYHQDDNHFEWWTNAAPQMYLDLSGNLGIGVTPTYKLDVDGTINTSGLYRIDGANVLNLDGAGQLLLGAGAGVTGKTFIYAGGGTLVMTIGTTGNVGINETTPDFKLDIETTNSDGIFVNDNSSSSAAPIIHCRGHRSDNNDALTFAGRFVASKLMSGGLTASGVRIGGMIFGGNHTDGTTGNIAYSASLCAIADGDFNSISDMPTALAFHTGTTGQSTLSNVGLFGTERMRVSSAGYVGINTTSPIRYLDVVGPDGVGEGDPPVNTARDVAFFRNNGAAADDCAVHIISSVTGSSILGMGDKDSPYDGYLAYNNNDRYLLIEVADTPIVGVYPTGVSIGNYWHDAQAPLHTHEGSYGGSGPRTDTGICIEDDQSSYLSFLVPAANTCGLAFGDPGDNDVGRLLYNHANNHMEFWTLGASQVTIDEVGDVGIGVTDPLSKLHVWVNSNISPNGSGTGYLQFQAAGYTGYITFDGDSMHLGHNSASRGLAFGTSFTTRLFISRSGLVGVGAFTDAAPPAHAFTVTGDCAPSTNNTYNCGDPTDWWDYVYSGALHLENNTTITYLNEGDLHLLKKTPRININGIARSLCRLQEAHPGGNRTGTVNAGLTATESFGLEFKLDEILPGACAIHGVITGEADFFGQTNPKVGLAYDNDNTSGSPTSVYARPMGSFDGREFVIEFWGTVRSTGIHIAVVVTEFGGTTEYCYAGAVGRTLPAGSNPAEVFFYIEAGTGGNVDYTVYNAYLEIL